MPGIALFLAYAGLMLGEERYTALSRRGFKAMALHVEQLGGALPGVGGFEGWGGILYVLTHLGALWHDSEVLERAGEVVDALAAFIDQDDAYGVVRGSAGAIGSLLAYHRCAPSEKAFDVAIACGDHLIAAAQAVGAGLGWLAPGLGTRPLGGFGHGAAGIAWALLQLAVTTGDQRYRLAAGQAIDYERSLYRRDAGNWVDLRQADLSDGNPGHEPPWFSVAWCHGAAGIGLARLHARKHVDDPKLDGEISVALHTTLAQGFGQSHCLCHGDMGNLELLLEAGRVLGEDRWRAQADRLAGMVLNSIDREGWQCGGPQAVEMPSLMLGLAGIGYQMLRLAEPDSVPSVLLLAPPTP
jgi:type 2 lantibiotic biosynthesis protein LanM